MATLVLTKSIGCRLHGDMIWDSVFFGWPDLEVIDVASTSISGSLPDITINKTHQLSNLRELSAFDSALSGTLPRLLSKATSLEYLGVGDLNLRHDDRMHTSSTIPNEYGVALTQLEYLYFTGVQLTGTIPRTFGLLTRLTLLDLHNNIGLDGTIPTEFGQLSSIMLLRLLRQGRFRQHWVE